MIQVKVYKEACKLKDMVYVLGWSDWAAHGKLDYLCSVKIPHGIVLNQTTSD